MTPEEARKVERGDRVTRGGGVRGEVRRIVARGFLVKWADGPETLYTFDAPPADVRWVGR
jgi:preprotein translocase subunit YajC